VEMINLTFVLRSINGRCFGNQLNLGEICRRCHERPLLFALTFDNELDDGKAAFKRLTGNNPTTLCTNLVRFGSVTPEFTT